MNRNDNVSGFTSNLVGLSNDGTLINFELDLSILDGDINFFSLFFKGYREARCRFPKAFFIIGGDANLPGLLRNDNGDIAGAPQPKGRVERFFCQHFLRDMVIAN